MFKISAFFSTPIVILLFGLKDVDDLMIRRFLRARDLDIEKASTMFLKYLSWRRTFLPKGFISESEISSQLVHNKLCMQGLDKEGRPIVVVFGGRHKPIKGNLEEVKRMFMHLITHSQNCHFFFNSVSGHFILKVHI